MSERQSGQLPLGQQRPSQPNSLTMNPQQGLQVPSTNQSRRPRSYSESTTPHDVQPLNMGSSGSQPGGSPSPFDASSKALDIYRRGEQIISVSTKKANHFLKARQKLVTVQEHLTKQFETSNRIVEDILKKDAEVSDLFASIEVEEKNAVGELESMFDVLKQQEIHPEMIGGETGHTAFDFVDMEAIETLILKARSEISVLLKVSSSISEIAAEMRTRLEEFKMTQSKIEKSSASVEVCACTFPISLFYLVNTVLSMLAVSCFCRGCYAVML